MKLPNLESIEQHQKNEKLESQFEPCPSEENFYVNDIIVSGWVGLINLDLILSYAIEEGASDTHIQADQPICFTVNKDIVKKNNFPVPDEETMIDIVGGILSNVQGGVYVKDRDFDFSYIIKHGPYRGRRFRANVGKSFGKDFLVFRTINDHIPTLKEIGIPNELERWSKLPSGVWLIGGATGSGKALREDTLIRRADNTLDQVKNIKINDIILDEYNNPTKVLKIHETFPKEDYKITTYLGEKIHTDKDHKWVVEIDGEERIETSKTIYENFPYKVIYLFYKPDENTRKKTQIRLVQKKRIIGEYRYFCFEVDSPTHTYLCTQKDIITHNSTTLASLIYNLQKTTRKKIITIEKPIEYLYPTNEGEGLVIQREVGDDRDTLSFGNGLTAAMRQNPDIILIGEVRNNVEVSELIRAAETGHLSISTIHTNSVPTTLNRIFSLFTSTEQQRIKSTLSDTLKGLCNQILVRKRDGTGVFAIREILPITEDVQQWIREGDVKKIKTYMEDNNMTMEQQVLKAYEEGRCTLEEALEVTPDIKKYIH